MSTIQAKHLLIDGANLELVTGGKGGPAGARSIPRDDDQQKRTMQKLKTGANRWVKWENLVLPDQVSVGPFGWNIGQIPHFKSAPYRYF